MQKNYLRLNEHMCYAIIFAALAIVLPHNQKGQAAENDSVNPNFFQVPLSFIAEANDWTFEEFEEKWSAYPAYLKHAVFRVTSEADGKVENFKSVLNRIAEVELPGHAGVNILNEDELEGIENAILGQMLKNEEKLDGIEIRLKNEGGFSNLPVRRQVLFVHLALCYNSPIGGKLERFAEIFGEPQKLNELSSFYFFGNTLGGTRFDFSFKNGIVDSVNVMFAE